MKQFFESLENRTFLSTTTVGLTSIDSDASETGQQPASFFVYRSDRLSVATRVFFTVGGTATSPLNAAKPGSADYTGIQAAPPVVKAFTTARATNSLITLPIFGGTTAFADIPAGETYTVVTIKPNDDNFVEGLETATFTLQSNGAYDIGNPSSVTLSIHDNDGPVQLTELADTYLRDGTSSNTSYTHDTQLQVKAGPKGFNRAALIQFDLTHMDPLATNVTLKLFGALNNANQHNVQTSVFEYGNPTWNESNPVTWNHHPIYAVRAVGPIPALATATITDTTARWYTFDVTAFVKSESAQGHTSCTLLLKNPNASDPYVWFNSKEASSNRPQLVFS